MRSSAAVSNAFCRVTLETAALRSDRVGAEKRVTKYSADSMAKTQEVEPNASAAERRYEITVEGEPSREVSEQALMSVWSRNIPDLALRVRAMVADECVVIFEDPLVQVRRLA